MNQIAKKSSRPLPRPNAYMDTQPFWDGAAQKKLMVQFCRDTGRPQFFPRPVSLATGRRNTEWREVSGRGSIYTFTNTFSGWPGHEERVPYLCALVELDEGARILTNLYNVKPEDVRIGMPVKVCWEELADGTNYPAFEPA
jgi:uncharacterized OB-fold protein